MFERVLILSPHTDDGELGCGGTIAKFVEDGKEVIYVALSACEKSVPDGFPKDILKKEVKAATQILGIKEKNLLLFDFEVRKFPTFRQEILDTLIQVKKDVSPDIVFTPSSFDTHQDHKVVREETLRAFKDCTILGYEQPWNNITFDTIAFVPLDERHVDLKVSALKMYKSQAEKTYFDEKFIKSLARTRGVQIRTEFAEVFEVIRWIIR
ncbi:LmbE-like protein [Geoglobus ahangari]|uniref:LmbE-like protein n=1 Tax=Geoglobus ahangari TaxID=113653 RepID=A0A0F7IHL9_9EURY|nr:PIG-L deacetylase family protein [Geoglobus ahangari]AKG92435.1 LmbE-like protein [Geoglobus ahangari]